MCVDQNYGNHDVLCNSASSNVVLVLLTKPCQAITFWSFWSFETDLWYLALSSIIKRRYMKQFLFFFDISFWFGTWRPHIRTMVFDKVISIVKLYTSDWDENRLILTKQIKETKSSVIHMAAKMPTANNLIIP